MTKRRRDFQRMEKKRSISEQNKEQRELRTPQQQLALLDERLGTEIGAKRERKILISQIAVKLGMNSDNKETDQKRPKTRSARRKAKAKKNKQRDENNSNV